MTSKRLFFKIMKEDLRHKVWMLVLSVLGNLLMLPVAWLLFKHNLTSSSAAAAMDDAALLASTQEMLARTMQFFARYAVILGGSVAIVGAFFAGFFGFYYLFNKSMVDTWHSLPVKRSTLYAAGYVNGLLIWLVPFLVSLFLMVLSAGSFTWRLGGKEALFPMMKEAFNVLLVVVVVYLLVYHLLLTAVMFCGNELNAFIAAGIMGFGVIGMFFAGTGICSQYFTTFSEWSYSLEWAGYASPLFSALHLIYKKAVVVRTSTVAAVFGLNTDTRMLENHVEMGRPLAVNLAVAVVLGLCAWFFYQKRESELAEQGIRGRHISAFLRIFGGAAAGLGGGYGMILLMGESLSFGWELFGMILCAVLAFGILNMAFLMDFKGFFAHKIQMGAAVGICVVVGIVIQGDFLGYDAYLPSKDKIAGISVRYPYVGNRTYYGESPKDGLERMNLQDPEIIYPYLERMVANAADKSQDAWENCDVIDVKVILKNGKTYYRRYRIYSEDKELLQSILASREYVQSAFAVSEEEMKNLTPISMGRVGNGISLRDMDEEKLLSIVRAYNQDVLENPKRTVLKEGKCLSRIYLAIQDNTVAAGYITVELDVYDNMEYTLEALKQAGYESAIDAPKLSDISSVELLLWYNTGEDDSPAGLIAKARQRYGVFEQSKEGSKEEGGADADKAQEADSAPKAQVTAASGTRERKQVSITARDEVEELNTLISLWSPSLTGSIFDKKWVQIAIVVDNKEEYCVIPYGALPEKYILRFGEF